MMRWILGLALLAACGRSASGPAWPRSAESEEDGGESLEPQHASNVAAIERAEDPTPAVDTTVVVDVAEPDADPAETLPATPGATPEPTIEVIEISPEDLPANP
jgi:hypothetical protein